MMAAGNGWKIARQMTFWGLKPTPKIIALQVAQINNSPCQIWNELVFAANRDGSHITAPAVTKAKIRIRV